MKTRSVFGIFRAAPHRFAAFLILLSACSAPHTLSAQIPESSEPQESVTVLALHSYNSEYEWTSNIISGLTASLERNLSEYQIIQEFMFAKRVPPEPYESTLVRLLEQRYRNADIDLIFISDEAAYRFFYLYGERLFPDIPMVFAAVDRLIPEFQRISRPHTGIKEQIEVAPNIKLISNIHPDAEHLIILSDERSILPRVRREIADTLAYSNWKAEPVYLIGPTKDELATALTTYPDAPMFYLGYFQPPESGLLPLTESVDLILSYGMRPLYSAWEDAIGTGILGGYMLSGTQQGKQAGGLITAILRENIDPVRLPMLTQGGNEYLADYRVMQKLGISPDAFPPETVFRNRPVDFLEVNRRYFTVALVIISLLGLLVLGLLINLRQLQREQKRIRALSKAVEATSHAVYITDPTPSITYVNRAFETLTGRAAAEVIGENPRILQSGKMSNEYYRRLWGTINTGQTWHEEIVNRRHDGSTYVAEQSISPLINRKGIIEGFVAIQVDTTEKRAVQDALIRAKQSAEEADRAKSAFLASISHEIRTPLNGILGFAHLILESAPSEPVPRYAEHILTSGDNLSAIINDILDLSIIEADLLELQPEAVHIVPSVRDILDEYAEAVYVKDVRLEFSTTPEIIPPLKLDPHRIRQVIGNLIDNAVKFTAEGCVEIQLGWSPSAPALNDSGTLTISVRDSGIGIPDEQLEQIFQAFHQIDYTNSRRYSGTGLGLAITKQLVEKMGGSLAAESTPGSGSHFAVTLPDIPAFASESDTAAIPPDASGATGSGPVAASPPASPPITPNRPAAGFPDMEHARAWLSMYRQQAPRLISRSVPAEILAWAETQLDDYPMYPDYNPARIIAALGTAARSWDITGIHGAFAQLEEYAVSLEHALGDFNTEDV